MCACNNKCDGACYSVRGCVLDEIYGKIRKTVKLAICF